MFFGVYETERALFSTTLLRMIYMFGWNKVFLRHTLVYTVQYVVKFKNTVLLGHPLVYTVQYVVKFRNTVLLGHPLVYIVQYVVKFRNTTRKQKRMKLLQFSRILFSLCSHYLETLFSKIDGCGVFILLMLDWFFCKKQRK